MKLIIFDLDGVLVNAKNIHYSTLNTALREVDSKFEILWNEHLQKYDGLKTNQKLALLTKEKDLPTREYDRVWKRKQELTIDEISSLTIDTRLVDIFKQLKNMGYILACCSNSIRRSVFIMLSKIGVIEYVDLILSNEDVRSSKPHPEIYWKAMSIFEVIPEETLIVEDSPPGLLAASRSGANILRVKNPEDLTLEKIQLLLNNNKNMNIPKWTDTNLNILIPMAGAGSRFQQAGYTFPKPLINVNGQPMIQTVINNLNFNGNYIFVVQKEHRKKYNLDTLLNLLTPNCKIIETDGITEGAACTTLLAKEFINNDKPLILANSDQYLIWDSNEFMYKMHEQDADGGIVTFEATHPKWSFAKINEQGDVIQVAEKNPISNIATAGIYYWRKGSDYVSFAEQMIENNIRVNNEFYICPVFNEAINANKKIKTHNIEKMYGIGTPEDLEYFLANYE